MLMNAGRDIRRAGVYYLILEVVSDFKLNVGVLGLITLAKGYYIYVGSARGRGGVLARVLRHFRRGKRIHWHIDYLTSSEWVNVVSAVVIFGDLSEGDLVRVVDTDTCFKPAVKGFGCCDYKGHGTHLYRYTCSGTPLQEYLITKLLETGIPKEAIYVITLNSTLSIVGCNTT